MKTTKQVRAEIQTALYFIEKAQKFIDRADIEICTKLLPSKQSYINPQGEALSPLTKWTGSELMYLINAKDRLKSILNDTEQ